MVQVLFVVIREEYHVITGTCKENLICIPKRFK
jgi:hypothetical protein